MTRYYSGNWELIAQRVTRELGVECQIIRKHDPPDAITDSNEIRRLVLDWRTELSANLDVPLDWDESDKAPYFTHKPDWDGYTALVLWAAHEQERIPDCPRWLPSELTQDGAYKRAMSRAESAYPQLLFDARLWLPAYLTNPVDAIDAGGNEAVIGSSPVLLAELDMLNRRTWNAGVEQIDDWIRDGLPTDDAHFVDATKPGWGEKLAALGRKARQPLKMPFELTARFGFAVFHKHAALSTQQHLPMLLDW